jgi:hypothetical protein
MVMKLVEWPSRRDRSFKSGGGPTKRIRRIRSGKNGRPSRDLRNGKLAHRIWNVELGAEIVPDTRSMCPKSGNLAHSLQEQGVESGNTSRLKEHAFGERRIRAQLPGMKN